MYYLWKYDTWYKDWSPILSSPSLAKTRQVERAYKKVDPRAYLVIFTQYEFPASYSIGFNRSSGKYEWGKAYSPLEANTIKRGLEKLVNSKYRPLFVKDSRGQEYFAQYSYG